MGVCNSAEKRDDFNLQEKGPNEGIHPKKSGENDTASKESHDCRDAESKKLRGIYSLFKALDTGNTGHLNAKDVVLFLKAWNRKEAVTHCRGSDGGKDIKKATCIVEEADMNNDGLLDQKEFTRWILGSEYDDEDLLKSLYKTVTELDGKEHNESLENVWLRYKDDDDGGDKIEENLSGLLKSIDLDPEGVQSFAFAWKLRHRTMGPISRSEFIAPLTEQGVETWKALISWGKKLKIEIKNKRKYKEMYIWLFDYVKEDGIRTIGKDVAENVWSLALAPFFRDYDLWLKYLNEKYELSVVKRDLWNCLYDFATEVQSLEEYDRDTGCWPSHIDDFIDYVRMGEKNI